MKIYFYPFLLVITVLGHFNCQKNSEDSAYQNSKVSDYIFKPERQSLWSWLSEIYLKIPDSGLYPKEKELFQFQSSLDSLLNSDSFLKIKQDLSKKSDMDKISVLLDLVYMRRRVVFDSSKTELKNIFPHSVWQNRKGNCMGTSLLLLLIAQELNIPLHGVVLPGHFFVRYQSSEHQFNLEPNRSGYVYLNDEYLVKYNIKPGSPFDLRNLNAQEVAGVFLYNLGSLYLQKGQFKSARTFFTASLLNFPDFSEAVGNLGLCFNHLGMTDSAVVYLERAEVLNPTILDVYHNLAALHLKTKKNELARKVVSRGLRKFPDNKTLFYDFACVWAQQDRKDSAEFYFNKSGIQ